MKNIVFIGGGEIGKGETEEIDSRIKTLALKGSSFVFFATAASDAKGYIETIKSVYGDHFNVVAATTEKGQLFSEDAIKNASVIYLGGGLTELLLEHFEEWNLVPLLTDAISKGVVVVGMSAGAQALSHCYIHEEADSMEVREGWGLTGMNACVLVHATEESFKKARAVYDENKLTCGLYGISESAALFSQDNNQQPFELGSGNVFKNT